jgi:hypothetical protein
MRAERERREEEERERVSVRVLWVDSLIRLRSRSFGLSMYYFSTIWRVGVSSGLKTACVSCLSISIRETRLSDLLNSEIPHSGNHISVQFYT